MPKIRDGAMDIHVGPCDCIRRAWHLEGLDGVFHGAVFSKENADIMARRYREKNIIVTVVPKDVFTQALHVEERIG